MIESLRISGAKRGLLFILVLLISTALAILLNIPILRQFLGFVFITIVPGLLIIHILKLNRLGLIETIVLSVGLSVTFLMFFGLLVNSLLPVFGYEKPLSAISLLISFSLAVIILSIAAYIRNRQITFSFPSLKLTTVEKAFLVVPALFPLLSILGTRIMNTTGNNICLMLLLFLIPAYVIFLSFYHGKVSQRLYPGLIYLIGISLLLLYPLRFNHIIIGQDTGLEFQFFQTTLTNLRWSTMGTALDPCLSISLVPAIYQSFLNMNSPESLFKLLYSFLFSVSPLVIYLLCRKYIGNFYAFLASFFFMSQSTFLATSSAARSNTAVLFFALAVMVLFHDGISAFNKRLLFILFTVSVIFSHYSTAYTFLFVMVITWIVMQVIPRIVARRRQPADLSESHIGSEGGPAGSDVPSVRGRVSTPHPQLKKTITIVTVILTFVVVYFWYGQITALSFEYAVHRIYGTLLNLQNLFILEARSGIVGSAFGKGLEEAVIAGRIQFIISWMVVILIAVGAIGLLYRNILYRNKETASPPGESDRSGPLKARFEMEYLGIVLSICLLLVAMVALPYISIAYNISRLWLQAMVVLSLCFVLGGSTLSRYVRIRPCLLILLVLVPYFMIHTGILSQLVGRQAYAILNPVRGGMSRMQMVHAQPIIYDEESYSAKWLGKHMKPGEYIYSDNNANEILYSQSQGISPRQISQHIVLMGDRNEEIQGYIYLRYPAVVYGYLHVGTSEKYDINQFTHLFEGKNKLYANGGSEVWR